MDVGRGRGVLILAAELHIHACARKNAHTCIHSGLLCGDANPGISRFLWGCSDGKINLTCDQYCISSLPAPVFDFKFISNKSRFLQNKHAHSFFSLHPPCVQVVMYKIHVPTSAETSQLQLFY